MPFLHLRVGRHLRTRRKMKEGAVFFLIRGSASSARPAGIFDFLRFLKRQGGLRAHWWGRNVAGQNRLLLWAVLVECQSACVLPG